MTAGLVAGGAVARVAALRAAIDELLACPLTGLTDDEVLEVARSVEVGRRRLETFDVPVVAELDARALVDRNLAPSTGAFLAGLWNVSPGGAARRVRHVRALGPRVTLTGDRLEPLRPGVAAARAEGAISAEHAEVILRTLAKLPRQLPVGEVDAMELTLVGHARTFHPGDVRGIGKHLLSVLDPDGVLTDEQDQRRRRHLSLVPSGDGMHRIGGELDDECAAVAMAVLHSLAAPMPTDAGGRDDRSAGQRMHDALKALCKLGLRAGALPKSGGVPATVLISMTKQQFETGTGLATTSFGQKLTIRTALRIAGQASIAWIVHGSKRKPLMLGRTRRLANEDQTLALIARDQGCAFPSCRRPPEWTEKHHVRPWAKGGKTDVDELCLLCDYHHDRIDHGWTIQMRDGIPWFTPPAFIDPTQTPLRNERP
jgi:hypothetical protein